MVEKTGVRARLERPLHVNRDRIEGCRGGDEQAIVVRAAKCQVGDDLIHDDLPQQHAIGRETLDAESRLTGQFRSP